MTEDFVRASEIQDYCYCNRGWWLRYHRKLPQSEAMKLGTIHHEELASDIQTFNNKKIIVVVLIGIGILIVILYLLIGFLL